MKLIFVLGVLLLACETRQSNAQKQPEFIPYYVQEVGYNTLRAYEHYVFVTDTTKLNDSLLLNFAESYRLSLTDHLPLASITFIIDTTTFPKDYDEQNWSRIRGTFYKDIDYDFRPGPNFSKPRKLGYWKQGKRIFHKSYK